MEKLGWSGSVNTTHLMAFQEPCATISRKELQSPIQSLERSGRRRISCNRDQKLYTAYKVNKNAEPPKFKEVKESFGNRFDVALNELHFFWLFFRRTRNSCDQIVPNFAGWLLQKRAERNSSLLSKEDYGNIFTSNNK